MDTDQIAVIERQMLEEHKKDIEALERLKRFLPSNPSAGQLLIFSSHPTAAVAEDDLDEAPIKSLRGAIEQAVNSNPSIKWTTTKVLKHLQEIGYPLKAKKPIYSIGQSLQKLVEARRIRLVRKGVGSQPNIYKAKIEESPEQEGRPESGDTRTMNLQ